MSLYPGCGCMAGNWTAQGQVGSEKRTRRLGASKRMRVVTILAVSLGVLMVLGSLAVAQIVGASCSTGWQVVSSADNSFAWTEPLPGLRAASWTGSVQLLENYDSGCYVTGIHLDFTGPVSGGTFVLAGNLFLFATIQYPSAFSDSGAVGTNAYGALGALRPAERTALRGLQLEPHGWRYERRVHLYRNGLR